jgi:hypothetical protein
MSKGKEDHTPITTAKAAIKKAPQQEVAIVCSVCGQGENLTGAAGVARWHAACEAARPDVIAKVKARA